MTESLVEELMLHNRTCSQCGAGEPCLVAEHIHDSWPKRVASLAAASLLEITATVEKHQAAA